ncbi:zf-HC2 domain-containing protein [Rehaibacterium terrae]|jgi:hypothetical protein|uniref:Anti-sigma factor ChrR (Cupin superfamily) n=2 Tax=Rehaibacterium terrae TaxID=1341696 RepID=A0A7W8DFM5_9GAMM|nr:zf-HC2 domain-containing protein [Rehaibacterium terrae]MBB5016354.1 anti-sigma factor ChrR (cupin superfamily) [Rehaibacterium terrae]
MRISDERLMAYVDGELDAAQAAQVEAAIAADPALAAAVARQRRLRERLRAAFDPVLDQPVPERLLAAARGATTSCAAQVVDLHAVAARRDRPRRWSLPEWAALAAALVLGLVLAQWLPLHDDDLLATAPDGRLLARGELAQALDTRLSGDSTDRIALGLSFRTGDGGYCRSFVLQRPQPLAGLACRQEDGWRVPVLSEAEPAAGGELRLASAPLPPAVLGEIDARIAGEPLDAAAERAARAAGWR